MKLQSFTPSEVIVNPAILARKGKPDKAKVEAMANNMLERREAGRPHQIQPGIVRINDEGVAECIVGQHRRAAEEHLNNNLGEGMEPFEFWAIAVPSTDEAALLDAIEENAWRTATTLDDKAYAIGLLAALKKTHEDISKHFSIGVSTVGEILRYSKLPAIAKKAYRDGLITEEAVFKVARHHKDPKVMEDVLKVAQQTRDALDAIEARAVGHAEAEVAAEAESGAAGPGDVTDAAEAPKSGKKKSSVPISAAVKGKGKKTPGKVTASDVADAEEKLGIVSKKGAKKKAAAGDKKRRNMNNLMTFMEVNFGPNVDEEFSEPLMDLLGKIEDWRDFKCGDASLKNFLIKCTRSKY